MVEELFFKVEEFLGKHNVEELKLFAATLDIEMESKLKHRKVERT